MPEQKNIEYKESWHDEYLKWICGFANAPGCFPVVGCQGEIAIAEGKSVI